MGEISNFGEREKFRRPTWFVRSRPKSADNLSASQGGTSTPKRRKKITRTGCRGGTMKHRNVEYAVEEDQPGVWRWVIHVEAGLKLFGEAKYKSREAAVAACIAEINDGYERGRL
jgi:hypothetical protein